VADEGNFVLLDGRMDDGEGVGAGGALEVFELEDGDTRSGGSAQHGGVFEAGRSLSEGCHADGKDEEQGDGEGDAVHCYKTHRIIFRILSERVTGAGEG
jgi:hypothetical protein